MSIFPSVLKGDNSITIIFRSEEIDKIHNIECVVDFNNFHELIGIEILDLKSQTECMVDNLDNFDNEEERIHTSYDREIDAFYIKISEGMSSEQRIEKVNIMLNEKKEIVQLKLKY
jgi:hypothetical protein